MFTKFKSAIYNVVGNLDPSERGEVNNIQRLTLGSSAATSDSSVSNASGRDKYVKFPYMRPHFLQFNSEDEISVTGDHVLRPIICPRDISKMPWNTGYAETVNAGKSKKNEDQASVHVGLLSRTLQMPNQKGSFKNNTMLSSRKNLRLSKRDASLSKETIDDEENKNVKLSQSNPETKSTSSPNDSSQVNANLTTPAAPKRSLSTEENANDSQNIVSIPYYYFGVFDGHAGWGAAVAAARELHNIVYEKLCDAVDLIIPDANSDVKLNGPLWSSDKDISPESAVVGALERAFWAMDQQIADERHKHQLLGGCTACVALFILGKLFVANAGDSRGTVALGGAPYPMSFDFTPETETQRVRKLGARHPELLGGEFTHLEFLRRPLRSDLGKKAPYREHYMKGWSIKTITESDLKYPLVCGEGKRSRVLATIGVTRGFGDHDLRAQFSGLPIKPFLSPEPEVRVLDISNTDLADSDVLILGTDGLWDIISNEKAVQVVSASLDQFPSHDEHRYKYRYTSAAHDLVLCSRGRLKEHLWRTTEDCHATIDDISVFVIPLRPYQMEYELWLEETRSHEVYQTADSSLFVNDACSFRIEDSKAMKVECDLGEEAAELSIDMSVNGVKDESEDTNLSFSQDPKSDLTNGKHSHADSSLCNNILEIPKNTELLSDD